MMTTSGACMLVQVLALCLLATQQQSQWGSYASVPTKVMEVKAAGQCSSMMDCSLNGECIEGHCVCDPQWRGAAGNASACDVMAFEAMNPDTGYHNATEAR